jgi:hypothetical protein
MPPGGAGHEEEVSGGNEPQRLVAALHSLPRCTVFQRSARIAVTGSKSAPDNDPVFQLLVLRIIFTSLHQLTICDKFLRTADPNAGRAGFLLVL